MEETMTFGNRGGQGEKTVREKMGGGGRGRGERQRGGIHNLHPPVLAPGRLGRDQLVDFQLGVRAGDASTSNLTRPTLAARGRAAQRIRDLEL
jgi:hypothetical protein